MTPLVEPVHTHRTTCTHTSVLPAHTWNQSADTEPGLVLSKMQRLWMDDLFTGRRKAGYHVARSGTHWCWCYSHCQMKLWIFWYTTDDSQDIYKYSDRLQADSDLWNVNERKVASVLYSDCIHMLNFIASVTVYFKLAQLIKGPILSQYLDHKFCNK